MRDATGKSSCTAWRKAAGLMLRGVAAALLLSLTACETTPRTAGPVEDGGAEKIKVRDLVSKTDPRILTGGVPVEGPGAAARAERVARHARVPGVTGAGGDGDAEDDTDGAPARQAARDAVALPLVAQLLVVPRDDPKLGLALTMIGDLGLEPAQQLLWNKNGCRIGQVSRENLTLFLANLPKAMDVNVTTMQTAGAWTPITLADKLRGSVRVRAYDATGEPKVHKFVGGEYQMLVKLQPAADGAGPATLQIMPHHYGATSSIVPRNPEQKILDGESFEDLVIRQPISVDQIWVITARVTGPTPADGDEAEDKKPGEAKAAPAAASANGATPAAPVTPALAAGVAPPQPGAPPNAAHAAEPEFPGPRVPMLGQSLFTGKRGTKNAQMILLIGLEKKR